MIPSIGRNVHYVLAEHDYAKGAHRPAIITEVFGADGAHPLTDPQQATETSKVNLMIFSDAQNDRMKESFNRTGVLQDPTSKALGSWHAPEVVPAPAPAVEAAPEKVAAAESNPPGAAAGPGAEPAPAS